MAHRRGGSAFSATGGYKDTGAPGITVPSSQGTGPNSPLIPNPEPIGIRTPDEAERHANVTRYWTIAHTVVLILLIGAVIAALVLAARAYQYRIGDDSLTNSVQSKVAEVLVAGAGLDICTGSHVSASGQVMTATHCFQTPGICDFDTVTPEHPLNDGEYLIEVMGVNGTTEKWTFYTQVLGWSGVTDVMVLQALPLTIARGGVITIVSQDCFRFGYSGKMNRGEEIQAMAFDEGFLKKLGHRGPVQAPGKDIGADFSTSIEQLFYDGNSGPGSSGGGAFNRNGNLVLSPLSWAWYDGDRIFASSGTSSDVSSQVVRRILDPNFPPNGPNNKYLVPTLGVVKLRPIGATFLWNWDGPEYLPWIENKGIWFSFLYTQNFFEFLTDYIFSCGYPPYQVTAPSILDAPLDVTIAGQPPVTFPAVPGDCLFCSTIVVLEAVERTLDRNDWVPVGEDAGLGTVSGVILGSGKWVGDVVRVRVRALDPYLPADPTVNWEAIYRVTLQAIDPYWDTIDANNIVAHAASIHVNMTTPGGASLYIEPAIKLPVSLKKTQKPGNTFKKGLRRRNGFPRTTQQSPMSSALKPMEPGTETLPTLLETYQTYYNTQNPARQAKFARYKEMQEKFKREKQQSREHSLRTISTKNKFAMRKQHPLPYMMNKNPNHRA